MCRRIFGKRPGDQEQGAVEAQTRDTDKDENIKALLNIAALSARSGISAAVVILPNTDDFELQRPDFELLMNLCREIGIPYLNLLDPFLISKTSPRTLRLNAIDSHPNAKYHELVAEQLAPFVQEMMP